MLGRITLFLLVLAMPAWAQEAARYIGDQRAGCKVWDAVPNPKTTITWSGACVGGFASGQGTLQWLHDGKPLDRYEGPMRDGKMNGRGVYFHGDGARYTGEFADDKRSGRGLYVYKDGSQYDGQWSNDRRHGIGTYTYADGGRYQGGWANGQRHGQGTMVWADGSRYEGGWSTEKAHGFGTRTDKSGRVDSGTWTNGCFRQGDKWSTAGATAKECGFQ